MADDKNADRSSIEIKNLLRKLDPDRGKHGDRVRAMTKFRNYVTGGNKSPEFYDDDLPLFFLGNAAPASYLDPDDDTLIGLYGLLQACGSSSSEMHDGSLKRSARQAMELCKQLVMDWKEHGQKKGGHNLFATTLLSLPVQYYSHMRLEMHCRGDDRGGARLEAFQLILLILKSHLSEDGEDRSPVTLDEVLPGFPKAQQEFEKWVARHAPPGDREILKKNAAAREKEMSNKSRKVARKGDTTPSKVDFVDDEEDEEEPDEIEDADLDDDDVVGALRKRRKDMDKELKSAVKAGEVSAVSAGAVAVRWEDCQLARVQKARAASAARAGKHITVRDSKEAEKEEKERESEKNKVLGKDPLGVTKEKFDLREIEKNQAELVEKALVEVQEELAKAEAGGQEPVIHKAESKKESIEKLVEDLGGLEAVESKSSLKKSVLPTSSNFDPILFLTLVHRSASYDKLVGSLGRLSSKTENQVEQLENLVRENFPLFVKCAEGFDEFRSNSENDVGVGLNSRIDKLDGIAESCAFQAKKSFRPLLDNTTEVRKVQSSIAVLQRVAPVLQAPVIMRQHLENRRYSEALKTYRRVLVVDESCKIDLLLQVRAQAEEGVREAQRELEMRLSSEKAPVEGLLDGIRDLAELLELAVPVVSKSAGDDENKESDGVHKIGNAVISIRQHSPALACLLLQAAHFSSNVNKMIDEADDTTQRLYSGETLGKVSPDDGVDEDGEEPRVTASLDSNDLKSNKPGSNQWKYDVLDARVLSTVNAVAMARAWLPRLLRVGQAAREDEKRKAARIGRRRGQGSSNETSLRAFEVFITNVSPALAKLMDHASFCALGSSSRSGVKEIVMTFGQNASDDLRSLLKSPLPPAQSSKVGKELADLVDIIGIHSGEASALRPDSERSIVNLSPFDECRTRGESAVVTLEKRRCIYAFDVCARASGNRASGSGKFDAEALLHCLRTLSQQLSRADECSAEVEKGCQLVVRRCCEGLAGYVRDRGDDARLAAVSECADVISHRIKDIVQEVRMLTSDADTVEEALMEDVVGLENAMFEEYMENLHLGVAASVKIGWMDVHSDPRDGGSSTNTFPAYLSASLLAIVRCRAQVEQTLGDKVRLADGVPYQRSCMSTVAQGVVEGICNEVLQRKTHLKVRQADKLANELEFLNNALKKFLGNETKSLLASTLNMANNKAGRGQDYQGNGPDGLAALEELERLGRVYVLCLGE